MRSFFSLVAVAGILALSACDTRPTQEAISVEDATTATDIAETTASPLDTAGVLQDTVAADSVR
ncbi:hypothetical protein [Rufibacter psychrotolerans]|uniref:hypothetical protein n=1 Tax=Rufibacter psychrotolerans TaxID=2812556 RepID=UPI001967642C|nr:hypothetical protein [Rufibacter sp. SYSU D00308]